MTRQRAALREHRLDAHQVSRSRRAAAIRFNFLSPAHDRDGVLAAIRKGRELMATRR